MNKKISSLFLLSFLVISGCGKNVEAVVDNPVNNPVTSPDNNYITTLSIDTCDLSGKRQPNVRVDVGVDTSQINREYFGYTNKHSQLVKVEAKELFLQTKEEEKHKGRYCKDEARVPGTEQPDLDQGHVIADSLGGASNAYNITPQKSNVNRGGGSQYNLEQEFLSLLKSGVRITDVVVLITYPNETTKTPSSYEFRWVQNGSNRSLIINNK